MNSNIKKKIILIVVIAAEIVVGFFFLFSFYQKKIVHKAQDADKAAIIDKENLVFPEQSEFQYYYELKPNTEVIDQPDWLGYQVKYTYNADGLNERFDYEVEKPSDTFRIITLGDSFTFGINVNTEENWTEQLEFMLNKNLIEAHKFNNIEVINLGMNGFDVPYLVKRYRDIGAKYHPDLIIWFESGSGFIRLNELIQESIRSCEKGRTIKNNTWQEINYCWEKAQYDIINDYSYELLNQIIVSYLDEFINFISQKDNEVIFFTFEEKVLSSVYNNKNSLEKWKEKFPEIDFLSIVPSIHDSNLMLADGHPTVEGHKTIANTIYEYLRVNLIN